LIANFERDEGSVDRGGACAAIGLQNVAINPDGAGSFEVDRRAD
jgi:hypothetical protein